VPIKKSKGGGEPDIWDTPVQEIPRLPRHLRKRHPLKGSKRRTGQTVRAEQAAAAKLPPGALVYGNTRITRSDLANDPGFQRIQQIRNHADKFRDQRIKELAEMCCGRLSSEICVRLANQSRLEVLGNYWLEQSIRFDDLRMARDAATLLSQARQQGVAAWELAIREADARARLEPQDPTEKLAAALAAADNIQPPEGGRKSKVFDVEGKGLEELGQVDPEGDQAPRGADQKGGGGGDVYLGLRKEGDETGKPRVGNNEASGQPGQNTQEDAQEVGVQP
jgi:hypothetical protein